MTPETLSAQLLKILTSVPKTAAELAATIGSQSDSLVSHTDVQHAIEHQPWLWWECERVTGEWRGFKYRKRAVLNARGKVVKEIGEFHDGGLSHSGQRAILKKGENK